MSLLEALGIKASASALAKPGDATASATDDDGGPPRAATPRPVPPSKMKPPPEPRLPVPENTLLQALHDEILHYDLAVKQLQDDFDRLTGKRESLQKQLHDYEDQYRRGTLSAALMVHRKDEYDAKAAKLEAEGKAIKAKAQEYVDKAQALKTRLEKVGGAAPYRSSHPDDAVDAGAHGARKLSGAKLVMAAAGTLASAYFIARDIRHILDADTALEGLKRTGKVVADNAMGAAEFALFKHITKSSPVAMVLGMVVGMCSDQANGCDAQEEAKRKKAEEKMAREYSRQEMLAVGKFLEQHAPGSVEWVEDTYHIKNQKVWDATVKRVRQMRSEYFLKQKLELVQRAHELGRNDGKAGEDFTHKDEIKKWPEVKNSPSPDMLYMELFEEYKPGFNEGNAKRKALFERARKLGYKDGKTGEKHSDEMVRWPEVAELLRNGTNPITLIQQLQESYREARAAVARATAK